MLVKSKKQAETTLNNIMSAVEQGVVNKTTNNRMKELEQQIEDIERQILVERSKTSIKISEEDIRKFYIETLKLEPLLLIDALIKQIKLYNDKIEITFNTPTLQSPNDKDSFLMLKNKMKKIIQNKQQPAFIDISVEFYVQPFNRGYLFHCELDNRQNDLFLAIKTKKEQLCSFFSLF